MKFSLAKIKRIGTPIIALFIFLSLSFVFNGEIPWFSAPFSPKLLEKLTENIILILFIGSGFFVLLTAECFNYLNFKHTWVNTSQSSFVTALNKKDWFGLLVQFPLIILIEEIVFRGIILLIFSLCLKGFLKGFLNEFLIILASSLIFCLYHLHIYLSTDDWKITGVYMGFSLIIGIILALFFSYVGIVGVWIYHVIVVAGIYWRWKNYEKKSQKISFANL